MEVLHFGVPQVVFVVMAALGIGFGVAVHGKPAEPYNMWRPITRYSIFCLVLYWGGFFTA